MSKTSLSVPAGFRKLLTQVKSRIQQAQTRAILAVNAELVRLYWDIGRLIDERQQAEGWGAGVIPRLSRELRNELPEIKGFSERNIKSMVAFYRAYPNPITIVQQGVAQLSAPAKSPRAQTKPRAGQKVQQPAAQLKDSVLWSVPWFQHIYLLQKIKDPATRLWYIQQILDNGWGRSVLLTMVQGKVHLRQGKAITNFDQRLPPPQSDLARQALKDPYIFDFLTLEKTFHERELETSLLREVERFLLELGQGFSFVGRQMHVEVGDSDFYMDLLFYHLKLRCFVVIDLKKGAFKPEYAGKMNFYLSVVDDRLRHESDHPSIGIILCEDRNQIIAEYTLRDMTKPIGISAYELTRALPVNLQSALPTVEQIEAELSESAGGSAASVKVKKQMSAKAPKRGARRRK